MPISKLFDVRRKPSSDVRVDIQSSFHIDTDEGGEKYIPYAATVYYNYGDDSIDIESIVVQVDDPSELQKYVDDGHTSADELEGYILEYLFNKYNL